MPEGPNAARAEIPRPAGALPGELPVWSGLDALSRAGITVGEVERALTARPGGVEAPISTAPVELPPTRDRRSAAVLCLLFERGGEASVVLTLRSLQLKDHRGEVSFPGGRMARGERPLEAALREADEEVGVEPASVRVIGQLTPLTTLRGQTVVHCFVGSFPAPDDSGHPLVANAAEVERVLCVPLAELAREGVFHEELWPFAGPDGATSFRPVPFFDLGDQTVWGATGRLLFELLGLVLGERGRGRALAR